MSYIEMKKWLDRQIVHREEEKRIRDFNSQICVIDGTNEGRIQVSDIDVVADLMGKELVEEDCCDEYVRRSFMYEGYKVFGLVEKHDTQNLSD